MKKVLTTLFFTLTVCLAIAQSKTDSSTHLTFKGVPLDGTLSSYVAKMKQNGFKHLTTDDGFAVLQGDFAGYKSCHVGVSTLKQKDLVHKIVVIFPEKDTWSTLSGNYFNLKKMLIEKYGEPSEVEENFDGRTQPDDDDSKMYGVKFDNCKYHSTWTTEKGEIRLKIDHSGVTKCYVSLAYFDRINGASVKQQAMDDL